MNIKEKNFSKHLSDFNINKKIIKNSLSYIFKLYHNNDNNIDYVILLLLQISL